ncbi:hypothetical protein LIER_33216 [Lithospermum erythrorhizon]|uniref:Uncharacterized protein n=1 Tax=Lithospermum erythrorhizon TaxID=34254 RepID=A0AAV3RW50_LITER
MLSQGTWIYSFQKKKSRFGILRRDAESEEGIVWLEFNETYYIFHNANSWEEDEDTLVLISLLMEPETKPVSNKENKTKVDPANRADDILRNVDVDEAQNVYEFFFNPPHLFGGRIKESELGYTSANL